MYHTNPQTAPAPLTTAVAFALLSSTYGVERMSTRHFATYEEAATARKARRESEAQDFNHMNTAGKWLPEWELADWTIVPIDAEEPTPAQIAEQRQARYPAATAEIKARATVSEEAMRAAFPHQDLYICDGCGLRVCLAADHLDDTYQCEKCHRAAQAAAEARLSSYNLPTGRRAWVQGGQCVGKALFELGRLLTTPAAVVALDDAYGPDQAREEASRLILRHATGDDGELEPADKLRNLEAHKTGARILSAYTLPTGQAVWVITDGDDDGQRTATTLLLPSDY